MLFIPVSQHFLAAKAKNRTSGQMHYFSHIHVEEKENLTGLKWSECQNLSCNFNQSYPITPYGIKDIVSRQNPID